MRSAIAAPSHDTSSSIFFKVLIVMDQRNLECLFRMIVTIGFHQNFRKKFPPPPSKKNTPRYIFQSFNCYRPMKLRLDYWPFNICWWSNYQQMAFYGVLLKSTSPGIEYSSKSCWGLTMPNIFRFFICFKYIFPCPSNEEKSHNIPYKKPSAEEETPLWRDQHFKKLKLLEHDRPSLFCFQK